MEKHTRVVCITSSFKAAPSSTDVDVRSELKYFAALGLGWVPGIATGNLAGASG
jgi:hypothetical protein